MGNYLLYLSLYYNKIYEGEYLVKYNNIKNTL